MNEKLFKLASFDVNVLQVYLLKSIYPTHKSKNELFRNFYGSKPTFYNSLNKLGLLESWDSDIKPYEDSHFYRLLLSLFSYDRGMVAIYLYMLSNPLLTTFSTKDIARTCRIRFSRVKELVSEMESIGLLKASMTADFRIDVEFLDDYSRRFYNQNDETAAFFPTKPVYSYIEQSEGVNTSSQLNRPKTENSISQRRFPTKPVQMGTDEKQGTNADNKEVSLDSTTHRFNWEPISGSSTKDLYIKDNNRSNIFNRSNTTNTGNLFPTKLLEEVRTYPDLILRSENGNQFLIQEEGMHEALMYIMESWNQFATKPNRSVSKCNIPEDFRRTGIINGIDPFCSERGRRKVRTKPGHATLQKIADWVRGEERWKEMWDEFIGIAEKNSFLKGRTKYTFKARLGWLFEANEDDGEMNLIRVIDGRYGFADEKIEQGVISDFKPAEGETFAFRVRSWADVMKDSNAN